MTVLEREYRFLIRRAVKHKDFRLAHELRHWAKERHGWNIPVSED